MVRQASYKTFALPNDLVERLDEFVATNDWGFKTRGEVMKSALRDFLRDHPVGTGKPKPRAAARKRAK